MKGTQVLGDINSVVVRSRLEKRRTELLERLSRITADVRHSGGLDADFAEQAVQRENDDVLGSLDVATRTEMLQIERALERLDADRYGTCEVCRQPISATRLEALPYATRCLRCQTGGPTHRNNPSRE